MSVQTMDAIVQTMMEAGDERNAGKLQQVLRKREGGLLQIAFCGHFSAGKSSLINKLCGHRLLPSSPIPTSANVVTISGGAPSARIVRESGKTETVDPGQLEEYCKDGQSIESIAITYPIPLLGDDAALLDTPGIDSTDGAHRLATESALHLADVVFYVMDYNHVQSEHNFAFTKRLQDWGKPLYLIVNQIDKHNDREIGFDAFRESVEQSFANWHIHPEGILYTSVRKPEHPFDEWGKLLWLLKQLMRVGDSLRAWSVDRSVRQLIEDHARTVQERSDAEKERLREAAAPTHAPEEAQAAAGEAGAEDSGEAASAGAEAEPPAAQRDRLAGERERMAQRLQEARQRGDTLAAAWKRDAGGIIDNANITPAATRDAAHHYLQSRKPGFKVGLFGRAAQTAKEIETRLAAFHADFAEGVRAQLEWHLTDFVRKAVESVGLPTPNYQALIDSVRIEVSADWLAGEVSPGAGFNGEYTLNYMKQVAADVKANARRAMWSAIESLAADVEAAGGGEAERLAAQLAALDGRLAAAERLAAIAEQERRYEQALLQSAAAFAAEPPSLPSLGGYAAPAAPAAQPAPARPQPAQNAAAAPEAPAAAQAAPAAPAAAQAPGAGLAAAGASRLVRTAERVRRAAALVAGVPAMQSLALSLQSKAERLADSRFTIALFGAFSAGKSSFANALIGERLLPVSPNPTTAAINTIVPPGESLPNHAARVRMKPEAAVFEEVKHSLDILGEPCSDWASALREIAALRPERVAAGGKPHYSFLKAVERGFAAAQPLFGQELVVRQEEFASYVADEQKSCFVETIALAHDNELTRQGMTFVDTPGADSINARHTGVAFNYIKNADVILFVTYYNHAFSQADREFLLQLGRVKDSFELDKMFFIVNAADLASNRDELQAVVAHVETNLLQHGIRKARIYPLSSQQAVEAKQNGHAALAEASGIAAFERDFIRFTVGELSDIAIRAAELEMGRAALELDDWIESAQAGEEERARRLQTLENSHRQAIAGLERLWAEENRTPELLQEIDELLHYVKQRTIFRFGDFFTMSFHPSALQDDGRDMRKAMRGCMLELQRLLSYQLSQELLATTLRVENKMRRLLATRKNESTAAVREALATFRQEDDAMAAMPTPEVDETLAAKADEKWLAGFYRSGRQFFENGGKDRLRTELEAKLMEPIDAYMRKHAEQFAAYYAERLAAELLRQREQVLEAVFEHAASRKAALEMRVDLAGLARTRAALDELIASPEQE